MNATNAGGAAATTPGPREGGEAEADGTRRSLLSKKGLAAAQEAARTLGYKCPVTA